MTNSNWKTNEKTAGKCSLQWFLRICSNRWYVCPLIFLRLPQTRTIFVSITFKQQKSRYVWKVHTIIGKRERLQIAYMHTTRRWDNRCILLGLLTYCGVLGALWLEIIIYIRFEICFRAELYFIRINYKRHIIFPVCISIFVEKLFSYS